jgi:hypothetical protein
MLHELHLCLWKKAYLALLVGKLRWYTRIPWRGSSVVRAGAS